MTKYNVHIYREMKLVFQDIEAESPQQAAETCREFPEEAACGAAVDCDGETFAALVDVQGDHDYSQSVMIAFEAERARQAVPDLLTALQDCIGQIHALLPSYQRSDSTLDKMPVVIRARAAIASVSVDASRNPWYEEAQRKSVGVLSASRTAEAL
jgi:hypothetical protein